MSQAQYPISRRTGEPKIPWLLRISAWLVYLGIAIQGITIFVILYRSLDHFLDAAWLLHFGGTHKPAFVLQLDHKYPPEWAGWRVILLACVVLITVVVTGISGIAAYYATAGYRWTRWFSLTAILLSISTLLLVPSCWVAIPTTALLFLSTLTPKAGRFFDAWQGLRHPDTAAIPTTEPVIYGPISRYHVD